jgi:hypothetical protein
LLAPPESLATAKRLSERLPSISQPAAVTLND